MKDRSVCGLVPRLGRMPGCSPWPTGRASTTGHQCHDWHPGHRQGLREHLLQRLFLRPQRHPNAACWHGPAAAPICDVQPTQRRAFGASSQWRSSKYRGRQLFPAHRTSRLDIRPQCQFLLYPIRETCRKSLNLLFSARNIYFSFLLIVSSFTKRVWS